MIHGDGRLTSHYIPGHHGRAAWGEVQRATAVFRRKSGKPGRWRAVYETTLRRFGSLAESGCPSKSKATPAEEPTGRLRLLPGDEGCPQVQLRKRRAARSPKADFLKFFSDSFKT